MAAYIQNIATLVPPQSYEQNYLRERMKEYVGNREATRRIIHRIYSKSGIERRHTVISDFNANGTPRFFFQKDGSLKSPSTRLRNEMYERKAKKFFTEVARKTIDENPGIDKKEITHVITVSCTGFFAPGPAFEIIKQLGLSPSTHRFHIGFMGCFAAFPAMKMAKAFCEARPDATVLIVCLELCSIHLQASDEPDHLISASVFADGGAGMIVRSQKPAGSPAFELDRFSTTIAGKSEGDMTWTIGDTGFEMVLSTYVPEIIRSNMAEAVHPLLNDFEAGGQQVTYWAIHPGGRAILDKVQKSLNLSERQLESSRTILKKFGNMSSATILFVLADILKKSQKAASETVLAMAFGPGLTIESGLFNKIKT